MKVNICGITHEVIECEDAFDVDLHFGMIDFKKSLIKINSDLSEETKKETLCHEIVHGILVHLGYNNLNEDETFVQALGNAINQTFEVKTDEKDDQLENSDDDEWCVYYSGGVRYLSEIPVGTVFNYKDTIYVKVKQVDDPASDETDVIAIHGEFGGECSFGEEIVDIPKKIKFVF